MGTFNKIRKNSGLKYSLVLIAGLFLGWLIFGGKHSHQESNSEAVSMDSGSSEETLWTCSMHPQIKMDHPGKCPICGMDLIPMTSSGGEGIDDDAIQLSKEAIALANIQTSKAQPGMAMKEIQMYGTIQADERVQQSQTSHVTGRIERLYITYTGEAVQNGQLIATIYSPDVLNAKQELIEADKLKEWQPELLEAAKEKLRLWNISEGQINEVLKTKKTSPTVNIYANTSGIVIEKNVSQGDYIEPGMPLFSVSNLSKLWAVFDAYEGDLPFLKVGDQVSYSLQSIPGKEFKGKISFINPIIDSESRTAKIRVEVYDPDRRMKPQMYATGYASAALPGMANEIIVPKSAVLWTGKRSIVYIKVPETETPTFKLREIDLGPSLGDSYTVLSGLLPGEEIVTNGAFTVDATAQLDGKPSMMNDHYKEEHEMDHSHHEKDSEAGKVPKDHPHFRHLQKEKEKPKVELEPENAKPKEEGHPHEKHVKREK